jgi:hypothetical protein
MVVIELAVVCEEFYDTLSIMATNGQVDAQTIRDALDF